jgi:GMP synthase-like glutamine amidotransferase
MKPVAIFRHSPGEGPGYFATFLDTHSLPWQLIRIDEGAPVPVSAQTFSGLCFMGGAMSVNDPLPWIPPVLELIGAAVAADVPVVGHCLGAQLMAKALGGVITTNPVKEIGWGEVTTTVPAAEWLGDITHFEAFHWHGETFSLPERARCILQNTFCANQAFVLGPHLGLQCHVEMTEAMIRSWNRRWAAESAMASASVQTPEQMHERMPERLTAMRIAADRLYSHWIAGLNP